MTRLIWIRHGITQWNDEHRLQGTSDVELNELGRWQAERLAHAVSGPLHKIYVSPLNRAQSFAAPLALRYHQQPQVVDELREMSFGSWEGLRYEDMNPALQQSFVAWCGDPVKNSPPGGEALHELAGRVRHAVERMTDGLADGLTVAAVTHGGVTRVAVALLLGVALDVAARVQIEPGSITVFTKAMGTWNLTLLNETCHLERKQA